jgi:hypothetical protein
LLGLDVEGSRNGSDSGFTFGQLSIFGRASDGGMACSNRLVVALAAGGASKVTAIAQDKFWTHVHRTMLDSVTLKHESTDRYQRGKQWRNT